MNKLKLILNEKKEIIYLIIISFFSISVNQFYGNLGVCPIDSFWFFNSGYDVLNGYYPFKDYWTIAGPFITFTQAFFFKILGVSRFSYVLHASIFNLFISISTFYVLNKFKLNINFCFLYALLVAIIAYPSAGTPYVDHHASILSIISLLFFILAIKTNSRILWFFLPIILGLSFLSKQTPSGNIFLIIAILSFFYFLINFDFKKILFGALGSFSIILIFFITLNIFNISFDSFFEQYISYPLTIGKTRVEYFLFPLEFSRIFLRFKLIHIPLFVLIFISIQKIKNDFKFIKSNDFIIILSLILSSYVFIAHQLMTINGMFIFFIIPILIGFTHFYYFDHYKKKNNILYLLIILSIGSTAHYGYKYIHQRDFMDLRKADFNQAVEEGKFIDQVTGLSNVKLEWVKLKSPDGFLLELLKYHSHPESAEITQQKSNKLGCSHMAFGVDNIEKTCEIIEKIGGSIVNRPALTDDKKVKVAYCHDIEGVLMEIVEVI